MRQIFVLMVTAFVDMIGFAIVLPLLPLYALRLQAEPWVIGWMIAIFSVTQLASAPFWGLFSDRFGRRPAILLGLTMSALAFTIFAFATTIWMLFLTRFVQGFGGGTTGVAQAYIGDATEPRHRARALGWLTAATSAGVMIGPALGSLAFQLGPAMPGLLAAGLCLANVASAWRWLPESHKEEHRYHPGRRAATDPAGVERQKRSVFEGIREVVVTPRGDVPRLIWIYAVGMLGFMSMTSVLSLYLEAQFGITEETIGPFFLYIGFLSIVMRAFVLGRMVDRFGETRVMRVGAVLLGLGLLSIPLPDFVVGTALVMGLVPMGTALLFPSVSALVSHRASRSELGQTLGVQQAFGGAARVIAPVWATAAFQGLGMSVPFFIAAGVVGFVTFLAFSVKPRALPEPEAA